jgi:hypothetical protein
MQVMFRISAAGLSKLEDSCGLILLYLFKAGITELSNNIFGDGAS